MLLRTHLAFGALIGILGLKYFDFGVDFGAAGGVLFIVSVLFFSVFPDIDHARSFVSRRLWFVAWLFNFLFSHRGVVHSLVFGAVVSYLLWAISWEMGLGAFVGYVGHLFMDAMSKNGVRPFFPLRFNVRGFVRSGGMVEGALFYFLSVLIIVLVVLQFR